MSYPLPPGGPGYPSGGYPSAPGDYPSAPGGYPSAPGGYPSAPGGYPSAPGGYPSAPGGYPSAPGGYPPAPGGASYPPGPMGGGYPPAAPGVGGYGGSYPPAPGGGGYPASGGYPTSGGYPPASAPGGYPPAPSAGYPPAPSGGYPPAPGGYPPAPSQPGYHPAPQPTGYPPAPAVGAGMPIADYSASSHAPGLPYNPNPAGMGFAMPPSIPYTDPYAIYNSGAAYATSAFRHPHPASAPALGGPPMPTPQYNPVPPAQTGYAPPPPAQTGYAPQPKVQPAPVVPTQQMSNMSVAPTPVKRGTGTVKAKSNFDGQRESEILRKAMKGIGTDEKAIISVLASCSNSQRQRLIVDFKTMYGKDLIKDFKSELKGKLEDIVLYLMMTPAVFDAHQLRKAMKGLGTDEAVLIEILCTRTNSEIKDIREAYKKEFSRNLEKDVISETSGHFQRLLVSMTTGARSEDARIDTAKAKADAKALWDAGEKKWGTDESQFNVILASRSFPQLRATFDEYSRLGKYSIEQSIKREMSGDLEKGMLTIVDCVRNTSKYFGTKLYKSMKGLGTDDDTLMRVIVSRCEVDMVEIKQEFYREYKQTLGKFIAGDTSGDYKKILIDLMGGES